MLQEHAQAFRKQLQLVSTITGHVKLLESHKAAKTLPGFLNNWRSIKISLNGDAKDVETTMQQHLEVEFMALKTRTLDALFTARQQELTLAKFKLLSMEQTLADEAKDKVMSIHTETQAILGDTISEETKALLVKQGDEAVNEVMKEFKLLNVQAVKQHAISTMLIKEKTKAKKEAREMAEEMASTDQDDKLLGELIDDKIKPMKEAISKLNKHFLSQVKPQSRPPERSTPRKGRGIATGEEGYKSTKPPGANTINRDGTRSKQRQQGRGPGFQKKKKDVRGKRPLSS